MLIDLYFVEQHFEFVDEHLLQVMLDVDYQHLVHVELVIVYEVLFLLLFVGLFHF
jgi:hypothetical protein